MEPNEQFADAVENGDLDLVRHMIEANPDLWHAELRYADTCLHVAAKSDHKLLAGMLGIPTVSVNCETATGSTPLHQACRAAHWQNIDLLLRSNANPNARTTKARYPPPYNLVAWLHASCILTPPHRDGLDIHKCTPRDREKCYSVLHDADFDLLFDPIDGSGARQWRIRQSVAYDLTVVDASVKSNMGARFFGTLDVAQSFLSNMGLTRLQHTLDAMGQPQKLPYYQNVKEILQALNADSFDSLKLGTNAFLVSDFPMAPRWDLPQNSKFLVTRLQIHRTLKQVAADEKWPHAKWKKNGIEPLKDPYPTLHRQNATADHMTCNTYSFVDIKLNAQAPMFVHIYESERAGISKPKSNEAKQRLAQKSKRRRPHAGHVEHSLDDLFQFDPSFLDHENLTVVNSVIV